MRSALPLGASVPFAAPSAPAYQPWVDPWADKRGLTAWERPPARLPPVPPVLPEYGANGWYYPGTVQNPELPPTPKDFRTRLREALSDENVRYYSGPGFYEAFKKLASLAQLLPGSGTVQSTHDASRGLEEAQAGNFGKAAGHYGVGTLNAALDWFPPAKLAIIGGTLARTFPWDRLPTAFKMEMAGRTPEEIWRATGLERAADSRWTFEISDKGFRLNPHAGQPTEWKGTTARLFEHYTHPGLQKAYPQLATIPSFLAIGPEYEKGYFGKEVGVIAPNLARATSIAMHELKHVIDKIERHPPGGSPQEFMLPGVTRYQARELYERLIGEAAARNAQRRLLMSQKKRRLIRPAETEDGGPREYQIDHYID
jgi:hypothetical protein